MNEFEINLILIKNKVREHKLKSILNGDMYITNTLFDKRYQDFTNKKYRWGLNSQFIGSCRTTKENAEQFLQVRLDEGTRV